MILICFFNLDENTTKSYPDNYSISKVLETSSREKQTVHDEDEDVQLVDRDKMMHRTGENELGDINAQNFQESDLVNVVNLKCDISDNQSAKIVTAHFSEDKRTMEVVKEKSMKFVGPNPKKIVS